MAPQHRPKLNPLFHRRVRLRQVATQMGEMRVDTAIFLIRAINAVARHSQELILRGQWYFSATKVAQSMLLPPSVGQGGKHLGEIGCRSKRVPPVPLLERPLDIL